MEKWGKIRKMNAPPLHAPPHTLLLIEIELLGQHLIETIIIFRV